MLLVGGDDLVEGVGDLAVEPGPVAGQLDGEVAAADALQGVQELAAVEDRGDRLGGRRSSVATRASLFHPGISVRGRHPRRVVPVDAIGGASPPNVDRAEPHRPP